MKTCKVCKQELELFDFPLARKRNDGSYNYRPTCKRCTTKQNLDTYHNKGGKEKQKARSFKHNLKRYGITPEDYAKLLEAQKGVCGICTTDVPLRARASYNLFVDHDHQTGKVRGLLCHNCNAGLGHFKDDTELLSKATEYLNANRP